ncbi:O-antigen ligase family protein [Arsenicibacter rosenii]|uniref:O-antigen ligase-related domain-containing protein n=1 Tax=Arsenicibacter rosenii TaxID=1750698 RepID=A0A1S2VF51_9BACT|nr:O-antigen ligase family protein [Arsenicibacter rosenii]OIN56518.1 hypothetical protein BLX24_24695 [Arsenicibacter rosenii]
MKIDISIYNFFFRKTKSLSYADLKLFLWFCICLTASFDIILNLRIAGFALRFVYLLIIVHCILYFIESILNGKFIVKYLGGKYFFVWFFFLVIFVNNTPLINRNIGYLLWLLIHAFYTIVLAQSCNNKKKLQKYVSVYLFSFLITSLFGFLQLGLGLLGIDLLVEQWWIEGRFPRLNGFSYEPSYYATYLIAGFSTSYFLFRSKVNKHSELIKYTSIISLLAIILSTSRMGLIVVVTELIVYELFINRTNLKIKLVVISSIAFVLVVITIVALRTDFLFFLFDGLGIMGSSAHSSMERLDGFFTQIEILKKNPFKGYSLGGVSQAIAFEKGVVNISQETIKPYDVSMNIFVEVLTASGIIGFLFFLRYIYTLFSYTFFKMRGYVPEVILPDKYSRALAWGLLFELIILCFNQNILRPYLWVHISILNSAFFVKFDSK